MPVDINKIKQRLQDLQSTNTKQTNLWKPSKGTSIVRIVPYKFNKDNPFIELYFHYGINNKNYLSPKTFGRPDPIVEFAEKLRETGGSDNWKLAKKLDPKMRTFVPVVVRGEESEGVRFWGFGKMVYQELLEIIADPDYGDITDPLTGRDIAVTFKTALETGKAFPETSVRVKPDRTQVTEDSTTLEHIIDSQKEITEIYQEPSYEDLEKVLEDWLNPEEKNDESSDAAAGTTPFENETGESADASKAKFDKLFAGKGK